VLADPLLVVHHEATVARDSFDFLNVDQIVERFLDACFDFIVQDSILALVKSQFGHTVVVHFEIKRARVVNVTWRRGIIVIQTNNAHGNLILLGHFHVRLSMDEISVHLFLLVVF
jgi:hypothetical protein